MHKLFGIAISGFDLKLVTGRLSLAGLDIVINAFIVNLISGVGLYFRLDVTDTGDFNAFVGSIGVEKFK